MLGNVAPVAEELEEVCVETDCVLVRIAALCLFLASLEEDGESREAVEALRAEVGQAGASHRRWG